MTEDRRCAGLNALAMAVALVLAGFVVLLAAADGRAADYDCSSFSTQAAAQTFFVSQGGPTSDPHGLDADADGVACESLPCPCSAGATPPPTPPTPIPPVTSIPPLPLPPPPWSLRVEVPATVTQGASVPIAVKGQASTEAYLFAYVAPSSVRCQTTAADHADRAEVRAVIVNRRVTVGSIDTAASFGPAAAGVYRVCAYATRSEFLPPDATASATFTIAPDPSLVPVLVSPDGEEHVDRLVLVWQRGAADENDEVMVYSRDPAVEEELAWSMEVQDADAPIARSGSNLRAVLPHLGYGRFWWNVTRPGPYGASVSETRTARVVPRPLDRARARVAAHLRLGKTSRRPGDARLVVRSSPRATVRALVRHAGRVVKRWSFTGDFAARKTLRLALSCAGHGPYRLEAVMVDPYGARMTRQVTWNITDRCQRLQAAERRRAEARRRAEERRREAERRRREAERRRQEALAEPAPPPSGGGGGGGGSYAGLNCSEIGHDFYVTPGSDPDHDADNDGHACESYA